VRRRLLAATLVVVAVAICALGLPLLYVSVHSVRADAKSALLRDAESVSAVVQDRLERRVALSDARLARIAPADRRVYVRQPDGREYHAGPAVGPHPYISRISFDKTGRVTVERSSAEVRGEQLRFAGLVVGLALFAAGIAAVLAIRLASGLTGPLLKLAEHARRLGSGDFRPTGDRYDIPEVDGVSEVLDATGLQLAELVNRERDLVGDISHQLRSRLTALSMRLEEVVLTTSDDHARTEAEIALEQADRLAGVIDDLVGQARQDRARAAVAFDVGSELAVLRQEWEPPLRAAGRRLEVAADAGLEALATPGRLHQALGVLVDNAVRHGAGLVTVAARASEQHVLIEVTDEGAGIEPDLARRIFDRGISGGGGTGLGLALARALVDADGGRLELRKSCPTTFGLFLRRAELYQTR
jgi:signal transduction histidine kinase